MTGLLIRASRVLSPDDPPRAPGWVRVRDGLVVGVGGGAPGAAGDEVVDVVGTVVPGFVDLHGHGGGGGSYADGADGARRALALHRRHGTTSSVASLVSDRLDALRGQVAALAPLVEADELIGVHLEGPWLSPLHAGAHDPERLRHPARDEVEALLVEGVRVVTLAPELPGGLDTVRLLAERSVVAALGHSDATWSQAHAAVAAGVRLGTHLFNASRGVHHREPGPAPALLAHDEVVVEVVADGVHLHAAVLAEVFGRAPGRVAVVSDATPAAGLADGRHRLGPRDVEVVDGVARVAGTDVVAGSTRTLAHALTHLVHDVGLSLDLVLPALTATPASVLGRHDLGRLRPGTRADLVVLDDALGVRRVLRRGRWVGALGGGGRR